MERGDPDYDLINNDSTPSVELVKLYSFREKGEHPDSIRDRRDSIVDKLIDRLYLEAHPDNPRDEIRTTTLESLSGEKLLKHISRRLDDDYYSTVADELKPIINRRMLLLSPRSFRPVSPRGIPSGNDEITPKKGTNAASPTNSGEHTTGETSAEIESTNNASTITESESAISSSSSAIETFDITIPTLIDLSQYSVRSIASSMAIYIKDMLSRISELTKSKSAEILKIFANRISMESIDQSYLSFSGDYNEISSIVSSVDIKLKTMIFSDSSKSIRFVKQIKEMNKQVIVAFTEFRASFRKRFINCLKKYYGGIDIFNNTHITLTKNTVEFLRSIQMSLADPSAIPTKHRDYDGFMDILNRHLNVLFAQLELNILDYISRNLVNGDDALMTKIRNRQPLSNPILGRNQIISDYYSLNNIAKGLTPIWNVKNVFDTDMERSDPLSIKRLIIFCVAYGKIDKYTRNDPECRRLLYFLFPDFMHDFEGNNVRKFRKFEDIFNFIMPTIYCSVNDATTLANRILADNSNVRGTGYIPLRKYFELTRLRDKDVIVKSTNEYLMDKLRTIMKTLKEPISDASSNEGDRDRDSIEIAKLPEKPSTSPTRRPSSHGAAAASA
jgi:hypothetical protein